MLQNKNNNQHEKVRQFVHSCGAWILTVATVICATKADRQPRITLNNVVPIYAQVDPVNDWARKDSETETVHMPTKFDIGLQVHAISGKK